MPDLTPFATELHRARLDRQTIAPLTDRVEGFDRPAAYEVQRGGMALRLEDGEQLIGGKLGFTSKAMQRAMNVDSPNSGWLTDPMLVHDGVLRLDELIHPKVEPEVAFLLGADLSPPVTAVDVLTATDAVLPCLEAVDSRFIDFRFGPLDNIADNSSAGAVVLGDPVPVGDIDLSLVGCTVWADDQLVATAAGAAALDHPAAAVAWMANQATRPGPADGRPALRAGDVVISGGLTSPIDLSDGMVVRCVLDRLGAVEARVA